MATTPLMMRRGLRRLLNIAVCAALLGSVESTVTDVRQFPERGPFQVAASSATNCSEDAVGKLAPLTRRHDDSDSEAETASLRAFIGTRIATEVLAPQIIPVLEFDVWLIGGLPAQLHYDDWALAWRLKAAIIALSSINGTSARISNMTTFYVNATAVLVAAALNGTVDALALLEAEALKSSSVEESAGSVADINKLERRNLRGVVNAYCSTGRQPTVLARPRLSVYNTRVLRGPKYLRLDATPSWQHEARFLDQAGSVAEAAVTAFPVLRVTAQLLLPYPYVAALGSNVGEGATVAAAAMKLTSDLLLSNPQSAEAALGTFTAAWTTATGFSLSAAYLGSRMQAHSHAIRQVAQLEAASVDASAASASGADPQPGVIAAFAAWAVILVAAALGFVILYRKRKLQRQRRQSASLRGAPSFLSVLRAQSFSASHPEAAAAALAGPAGSSGSGGESDDPLVIWRHNPSRRGYSLRLPTASLAGLPVHAGSGSSSHHDVTVTPSRVGSTVPASASAADVIKIDGQGIQVAMVTAEQEERALAPPTAFPASLTMSSIVAFHVGMVRVDAAASDVAPPELAVAQLGGPIMIDSNKYREATSGLASESFKKFSSSGPLQPAERGSVPCPSWNELDLARAAVSLNESTDAYIGICDSESPQAVPAVPRGFAVTRIGSPESDERPRFEPAAPLKGSLMTTPRHEGVALTHMLEKSVDAVLRSGSLSLGLSVGSSTTATVPVVDAVSSMPSSGSLTAPDMTSTTSTTGKTLLPLAAATRIRVGPGTLQPGNGKSGERDSERLRVDSSDDCDGTPGAPHVGSSLSLPVLRLQPPAFERRRGVWRASAAATGGLALYHNAGLFASSLSLAQVATGSHSADGAKSTQSLRALRQRAEASRLAGSHQLRQPESSLPPVPAVLGSSLRFVAFSAQNSAVVHDSGTLGGAPGPGPSDSSS